MSPSKSESGAAVGGALVRVVDTGSDTSATLIEKLALGEVDAVVVVAGGGPQLDEALRPRLTQVFGRGLLRAMGDFKALCVMRARDDALADLLGQTAVDALRSPRLLGVAPAGQLRDGEGREGAGLVPGLTHLLSLPGDQWGDEMRARVDLVQALCGGRHTMLLLIGGQPADLGEVLQAVRRGWPVVVVKGSGGAADLLVTQGENGGADIDDPLVAEILADGKLTVVDLGDKIATAVEVLSREVERACGGLSVLRQVWQRFAAIDAAAIRQQKVFMRNQMAILLLGVAAVVLAAFQTLAGGAGSMTPEGSAVFAESAAGAASGASGIRGPVVGPLQNFLGLLLIVVPILLSVMVAGVNRFNFGKRWVLLRASAEGIKREIYLYRLHAQGYESSDKREKQLKSAVEDVTRRLARTEVNTMALAPYNGPIPPLRSTADHDDGLSLLSTDQYVRLRLQHQMRFYRGKSVGLEKTLKWVQYLVLVVGGIGTFFGAIGGTWVIWIATTTTVASALASYLTFKQVETTLMSFNQTATDLENIEAWWLSLEAKEQKDKDNIALLGKYTERVLETEVGGWSQRMSDALEKLRAASENRDGVVPGTSTTQISVATQTRTTEVSTESMSETTLTTGATAVVVDAAAGDGVDPAAGTPGPDATPKKSD